MRPQAAHVLERLRAAGRRGIHSNEFRRSKRGNEYIADPAKRVSELVNEHGYEIESRRERLHGDAIGARYILHPTAEVAADTNNRSRQSTAVSGDPGGVPTRRSEPVTPAGFCPSLPGGGPDPRNLAFCPPHGDASHHCPPLALGSGAALVMNFNRRSIYYGRTYWRRKGFDEEPAQQELMA